MAAATPPSQSFLTIIHRFVTEAHNGTLARCVGRVRSGWVALGDPQILPGYCLLYPDPVVPDLHDLMPPERAQFLADLGLLGEAVFQLTQARRINYEMLGNVEPALHAHVIPRYESEPAHLRSRPIWSYDWDAAPRYDAQRDQPFRDALHRKLQSLGAIAIP